MCCSCTIILPASGCVTPSHTQKTNANQLNKNLLLSARAAVDWLPAIAAGRNDLEPPALSIQPVIAEVLTRLRESGGCQLARMSGSGATCFGLFSDKASAENAERAIRALRPYWWVVATTLS